MVVVPIEAPPALVATALEASVVRFDGVCQRRGCLRVVVLVSSRELRMN
jgi:hypothetical protein